MFDMQKIHTMVKLLRTSVVPTYPYPVLPTEFSILWCPTSMQRHLAYVVEKSKYCDVVDTMYGRTVSLL